MESKSFEISVEVSRGKLRGVILERSKGFSSQIRFGELSLQCLLEGVEDWCREDTGKRLVNGWEDGERKYRLEKRPNEVGRFILCSVWDLEAKKFCLVFLEGKGFAGGWTTLAEKLGSLGIVT